MRVRIEEEEADADSSSAQIEGTTTSASSSSSSSSTGKQNEPKNGSVKAMTKEGPVQRLSVVAADSPQWE